MIRLRCWSCGLPADKACSDGRCEGNYCFRCYQHHIVLRHSKSRVEAVGYVGH